MKHAGIIFGLLFLAVACSNPRAPSETKSDPTSPQTEVTNPTSTQPDRKTERGLIEDEAISDEGKYRPEIGDTLPPPSTRGGKSLAQIALDEARRQKDLAARGIQEIGWEDLWPEGERERMEALFQAQMQMIYNQNIGEGSPEDTMVQIGTYNTVDALDRAKIRMAGYTVTFTFAEDAPVKDFLLVPYYGACLHAPPPPPNQTVLVQLKEPIRMGDLAQAVWVEGEMRTATASTDLADAAYTLTEGRVEEFVY